jgi:hypothetical protein
VADTNRYGPGVSWRAVRRWCVAGIGLWFPAYLRDSERQHISHGESMTVGQTALPTGFRVNPQEEAAIPVPDRIKHPEQRMPLILIVSPGLTEKLPERQADRTFKTEWSIVLVGAVHGANESDAELAASVYGLALVQMFLQQAGAWADDPAYLGPPLGVDSVAWGSPGLDFSTIEASRRRSIVAAEANFTVVFRDSASSSGPPSVPVDPTVDPGDWPEVIDTELNIDREGPGD